MVEMNCPHCGHELRIDERHRGQRGVCKHCQGSIEVPSEPLELAPGALEPSSEGTYPPLSEKPSVVQKSAQNAPRHMRKRRAVTILLLVIAFICGVAGGIAISQNTQASNSTRSPRAGTKDLDEEVLRYKADAPPNKTEVWGPNHDPYSTAMFYIGQGMLDRFKTHYDYVRYDVNGHCANGGSLLGIAAQDAKSVEFLHFLLEVGADPDVRDEIATERTPLWWARNGSNSAGEYLLRKYGADESLVGDVIPFGQKSDGEDDPEEWQESKETLARTLFLCSGISEEKKALLGYDLLYKDMAYEQVCEYLGGEGALILQLPATQETREQYCAQWEGRVPGSVIRCWFVDKKLVARDEIGLHPNESGFD